MTTNANQIQLKGGFQRDEKEADATITPGHLIEQTTTGVKVHATEGGYSERAFAVEDALQGNLISDDYSSGDLVSYNLVEPGGEVQAWLKAGQNVVIGDDLISAGDGTLIENGEEDSSTTVRQIIGQAQEAVDLSGSGAVATRIDIRVL